MADKMVLVPAKDTKLADHKLSVMTVMLPKSYQTKGNALLTALDGKIEIDERCHVIYEDGTGSHIIDLVKYFITPKHLNISRPFDARKFGDLLENFGIPKSLINRDVGAHWMHIY